MRAAAWEALPLASCLAKSFAKRPASRCRSFASASRSGSRSWAMTARWLEVRCRRTRFSEMTHSTGLPFAVPFLEFWLHAGDLAGQEAVPAVQDMALVA